jgi:DNA-binding NtrC family response regulator
VVSLLEAQGMHVRFAESAAHGRARAAEPGVDVVVVSARLAGELGGEGAKVTLEKPLAPAVVLDAVRAAISRRPG